MKCRHCYAHLEHIFLDLGYAPPSNAYLTKEELTMPEVTYPLKLYVCDQCWLVQTIDYTKADALFSKDYAYFSSTSQSWLAHAADYAKDVTKRLGLTQSSFVIEVASNDGYLLKNFLAAGIPCLGVEPTDSTAVAAELIGIPVLRAFFNIQTATLLAESGNSADLICGNNVYAHVPDINNFTNGLRIALKQGGTISLEFPHLMRLIEFNQFDTVYHEHFSYLSLTTVVRIFAQAGLRVFDIEELTTHGGSLRVYGCHDLDVRETESSVSNMMRRERAFGLQNLLLYQAFQKKADKVKNDFLTFLLEQKKMGKSIAAYGAAAKGNTLLNYAGIKSDLIHFICDAAPSKQGKYMPGSHIPIVSQIELVNRKPDWIIVFPWNILDEIMKQQHIVYSWGGLFVTAVPELRIMP
jgi:hypothetical protein